MWQQGQVFKLKAKSRDGQPSVGVPLSAGGARLGDGRRSADSRLAPRR